MTNDLIRAGQGRDASETSFRACVSVALLAISWLAVFLYAIIEAIKGGI